MLRGFEVSQGKSGRPKWPYVEVFLYMGAVSERVLTMSPMRRLKFVFTMSRTCEFERWDDPYVSTKTERGRGSPMAYESWTRTRLQMPASTRDLATQRAAYAADLSTLEQSLPEKAPPP